MKFNRQINRLRSQKGILGCYMNSALVLIALSLGTLAVDLGHIASVRHEMQNAVDAAALSGAQDLSSDPSACERHAITVCRQNLADGLAVANESADMNVVVTVNPSTATVPGTVRVTAVRNSENILAKIFGNMATNITVTALAGGTGTVVETNGDMLFPLAVSMDEARRDLNIRPLNELHVGDTFDIYINSQQFKNAAFTSFSDPNTNANWIKNAIAQSLNLDPKEQVSIPPVAVGDEINIVNGVIGEKTLADDPYYAALYNKGTIFLPVIEGGAPFTQTRTVVGFIGVHVNTVSVNLKGGVVEKISVTIMKPISTGTDGILPSTYNTQTDAALNEMSLLVCKLLE